MKFYSMDLQLGSTEKIFIEVPQSGSTPRFYNDVELLHLRFYTKVLR